MREALFIKKNKDRWLKNQQRPATDPDEMAKEFTQLVDDLAYAKTFYPESKITRFINGEAARIYLQIYQNRREETNRLLFFWKYELPLTIWKHRRYMLFSTIVFIVFFAIGFFASAKDETVARSFFGDAYYEHTQANIANGNPFGIYEHGNPFLSWIQLMIHNIRVSIILFVSGLFAGLPCLYFLAQNAAMVGIFDHLFASNGLGIEFFLVVFVHGTLELTAIVISGGAVLILGMGFIFPGTVRRLTSLKQAAKDAVKIMIGLMPVFALAAFFEGFITRLYNDLSILTSLITVLSVLFVICYFVVYPARLVRRKKFLTIVNDVEETL